MPLLALHFQRTSTLCFLLLGTLASGSPQPLEQMDHPLETPETTRRRKEVQLSQHLNEATRCHYPSPRHQPHELRGSPEQLSSRARNMTEELLFEAIKPAWLVTLSRVVLHGILEGVELTDTLSQKGQILCNGSHHHPVIWTRNVPQIQEPNGDWRKEGLGG